ncbi:MAG: putative metal-binding motif-containing protein, partial [Myxococcota bacterium]
MLVRIPIACFILFLSPACLLRGGATTDTDPQDPGDPVSTTPAPVDEDDDGFAVDDDCDDTNAAIFPGADEVCDAIDNDCDGDVDVEDADLVDGVAFFPDVDGDGFGDDAASVVACEPADGFITEGGDCDDNNADLNPGAIELCDGLDNDCDAATAEAGLATFFGEAGPVDFT